MKETQKRNFLKGKAQSETASGEITFEAAFKKLQKILENLESHEDEISLDNLIANYQEGLKLLQFCRKKLTEAKLKIEEISTEQEK